MQILSRTEKGRNISPKELWQAYRQSQEFNLRQELIVRYLPLVKYVVDRMNTGNFPVVNYEDLISAGIVGLIHAVERYDPDRDVKFETYAISRVKGSIIDQLRKLDWLPRNTRHMIKELEETYSRVEVSMGRPATGDEVAQAMGIKKEKLNSLMKDAEAVTLFSLEQNIMEDGSMSLGDTIVMKDDSPADELEKRELVRLLAEGIDNLPKQERLVISLYYYEGLTLKEIGATLKLSTSRISQIHTKAVLRLRGRIKHSWNGEQ